MGKKKIPRYIADTDDKNILQRYFEDVGKIYEDNDNDFNIEYSEENREKLLKMNLKCVIKVAKGYRGRGMTLDELISAGNEGLCIAWEKYKPSKNKIREDLLEAIDKCPDEIPAQWIMKNIGEYCEYGKYKEKFIKKFLKGDKKSFPKEDVRKWVDKNISNATFNSVAMLWVNAYIRQELNKHSRLIKKPIKDIKLEMEGKVPKEVLLDISSPMEVGSNNMSLDEKLDIVDDTRTELDEEDTFQVLHDTLKVLFTNINLRDRRLVLQRFGVGYVRPFQPKEIAELENISVARVSQILSDTLKKMQKNAENYGLKSEEILSYFD